MAERFDFSRLSGSKVTPLPGGGVRVPAYPSRAGVQEYRRADGSIRREYRPPEQVFDAASLASFRDAPVVVGHPTMLRTDDRSKYQKGHISGEAVRADERTSAELAVTDLETCQRIDAGELVELSCGYTCDCDETPGVTSAGEKYDAIQTNIRINHVGLGPKGWARGGSSLAIRTDSLYSVDGSVEPAERTTMKVVFDGKEFEAGSAEHLAAIESWRARQDGLAATQKAEVDRLTKEVEKRDGQIAALTADLAKEAKARKDEADGFAAKVAERVALEAAAKRVFPEVKTDGSDDDIRRQVVQKAYPDVKLDGRSSDYVLAMFDRAVESGQRTDSVLGLPSTIDQHRADGDKPPAGPKPDAWKVTPAFSRR